MSSRSERPRSLGIVQPKVAGATSKRADGGRPFRWSWRIATLLGVDVYVHATLIVMLAWIALGSALSGGGPETAVRGLVLTCSVFACVVLHELGHAAAARSFGIRTRDITLLPIGGIARLERLPERPLQELVVALAGPAVNVALAAGLGLITLASRIPLAPEQLSLETAPFFARLVWINVSLALFNLVPAFPMDGGRALRALLSLRWGRLRATEVAAVLGRTAAIFFVLLGIFWSPVLIFIGAFVWLGAETEATLVELASTLHGLRVRDAMISDFRAIDAREPLARAVELTRSGFQRAFPVIDGGEVVGVATRRALLRALASEGADALAGGAADRGVPTASPLEMLDGVFERLNASGACAALVVEGDVLVGLVTPEVLGELILARGAGAGRPTFRRWHVA